MNKKKILLFINMISLLLLVTVSFAWINEINTEFSKFFELKYNSLYISPTQVDVKLYRCENNSNIDITQLDKTTAVYTATNVVPGEYSLYVLKLTNKADVAMNVAVNYTNITGSEIFYEFINICIFIKSSPVNPACIIVLTITVVISILTVSKLITSI